MNWEKWVLSFVLLAGVSLSSFALPPDERAQYDDNPMGTATFDGKTHEDMDLECDACHPAIFDKKPGRTKISFADHHEEKSCFACHEISYKNEGNCMTCHSM